MKWNFKSPSIPQAFGGVMAHGCAAYESKDENPQGLGIERRRKWKIRLISSFNPEWDEG
jgi:hypothetical protein